MLYLSPIKKSSSKGKQCDQLVIQRSVLTLRVHQGSFLQPIGNEGYCKAIDAALLATNR